VFLLYTVNGGCLQRGDSGGPVYILKKAHGLNSGGINNKTACWTTWYYFPIDVTLAGLNMQLLTS
jgi:hypothetical protein